MILIADDQINLWKWPNFLLLAWLLGFLIKKHGAPLLTSRSEGIRQGLEAGEKAKAEAQQRAAGVDAKIATLDREIAALRTAAKADLERETTRIQRDAATEVSRIERHTENEIVSIGKQARLELRRYAADLALDLAEQKIRARMSPEVQSTLVENFAGGVERMTVSQS